MTEQEAKEYVNSVFDEHFGDMCVSATNKFALAQDLAIEALEKQIPKKPAYRLTSGVFQYKVHDCPNCGEHFGFRNDVNYCENCGQKLDWGDEE